MNDICATTSKMDPYFRQLQPQGRHLLPDVRLLGELSSCPSPTTRWCTCKGSFYRQDAGHRMRRSSAACGPAARLHGSRTRGRSCCSWAAEFATVHPSGPFERAAGSGCTFWSRSAISSSRACLSPPTSFYLAHPELWELDFSWRDSSGSVPMITRATAPPSSRKDKKGHFLLTLCNFSPSTGRATVWAFPARAGTRWPSTRTIPPSAETDWAIWRPLKSKYIRMSRAGAVHLGGPAPRGRSDPALHQEVPAPPQKGGALQRAGEAGGQAAKGQTSKAVCRRGDRASRAATGPRRRVQIGQLNRSTYAERSWESNIACHCAPDFVPLPEPMWRGAIRTSNR